MSQPTGSLPSVLWKLSKHSVTKVMGYKERGDLIKTKTVYVKTRVRNMEYNKGVKSFGTSYEYMEREEWHWKDQYDFIQNVLKSLGEYHECLSEVENRYKVTRVQADFWLSAFLQSLLKNTIESYQDEFAVELISVFINDLEKGPLDWKVKIWIKGVYLADECYELMGQFKIRRPHEEDFEMERPFDLLPLSQSPNFGELPDSILEILFTRTDNTLMQKETQTMLDVLKLFRLGSVNGFKTETSAKSLLNFGTSFSYNPLPWAYYSYGLESVDITPLNSLYSRLSSLLAYLLYDPKGAVNPVSIAFQRYKEALVTSGIESRITLAITCLEALFLKAEERAELSHRLAQRTSALLRLHDFTPLEVYKNVNQAYDIRSTFVHGSALETEQLQTAPKLCEKILEYARVCLLVYLQCHKTIEKDRIINKLDNSMLEEHALNKTKESLAKDILVTK